MNISQALAAAHIFAALPPGRNINAEELCQQIGIVNVLAISGGRKIKNGSSVIFPVSNGYFVTVTLNVWDLYDVKLFKANKNKAVVKSEWSNVGAENISETAYQASCFNNYV